MHGFAGILFQMDTFDPHQTRLAIAHFNQHFAFADDLVIIANG